MNVAEPATLRSGYTRTAMAEPPPTRLHIDPPMNQWQVTPRNGRTKPIIATGHQPTLWHPGILAKYLAADAIAKHIGGRAMNVVVVHNPIETQTLILPTYSDGRLSTKHCKLTKQREDIRLPPNVMRPIDAVFASESLEAEAALASTRAPFIHDGLRDLAEAYDLDGDTQPNHAQQMVAVLAGLMHRYLNKPMRMLTTSQVVTPGFVERMLADPIRCVRRYNRAAVAYPEAGIRPLYLGRDVVEVPLWAQGDGVCTPVFLDLGDSGQPLLFTQGQTLDLTGKNVLQYLRPRAITLSAIMRSEHCDLFIHGTGGGVYDQVTERWWHDWTGEDLAPNAVVSADMFLPFDVPTSTQDELARSQWYAHHLPHNIDRHVAVADEVESALRHEKRELLDRMNDDRDKRRRSKAFRRIHAINAELATLHKEAIAEADKRATDARVGVQNAAIASRRDWCFALYPDDALHGLRQAIEQSSA